MNAPAPPPPIAPLWERLRAAFQRVIARIGAPAAIALVTFASRNTRLNLLRQLAMLESLVRKLLLVEAAALEPPRAARGPRLIEIPIHARAFATINQRTARSVSQPRPADLASPESWRATFTLSLPRDPHMVSDRHAPRIRALWGDTAPAPVHQAPSQRTHRREDAFLIARRFEALRRVLNDPAPHARRLAAAHQRASTRSPELTRRYALSAPRSYHRDPYDLLLSVDVYRLVLSTPALADTS